LLCGMFWARTGCEREDEYRGEQDLVQTQASQGHEVCSDSYGSSTESFPFASIDFHFRSHIARTEGFI